MAQTKTTTVSVEFKNNSPMPTTVSPALTVEAVVVDNALVADFRHINPGVVAPIDGNVITAY